MKRDKMKWYKSSEKVIEFVKFLVDANIINDKQKLSNYFSNLENCNKAYAIYEKKIKPGI